MSALPNAVRPSSRGFYAWFATGAFLIIFAGFARTYYLRPIFEVRPLPLLLHLHGFLFTSWFVLFFVQARLVAKDRVDLHQRLGISGAILAPLCTGVALTVAGKYAQQEKEELWGFGDRGEKKSTTGTDFAPRVGCSTKIEDELLKNKKIVVYGIFFDYSATKSRKSPSRCCERSARR